MTELNLAKTDLGELKPLLDIISAPMMIIEVMPDKSLRYGMFNQAAEEYYGLSNAAFSGKPINPYRGNDDPRRLRRQVTIDAYNQSINTRDIVSLDMEHVHSNGETRWGQHHIAPAIHSGTVTRLIVTSVDVTELVATRTRLSDALTKTLSDYMTICASCKDVKSDHQWVSIEEYASKEMDYRSFSHGLCPKCHDEEMKRVDEESGEV